MKMCILAIRDRAIDAFGRPMFMTHSGAAVRGFGDEINKESSEMYAHPDDYDLYELGTWDDNTGAFDIHPHPLQIAIGKNLKIRN